MPTLRKCSALVVLLVLVAGCRPSAPSASQWREQASQALEDVASELVTAGLTLKAQQDDKLLGRTGVILLVDAEESAGSTAQDFSSVQPPSGFEGRQRDVVAALQDAASLITKARTARVAGATQSYPELTRTLARDRNRLSTLSKAIR